jgi:glycosyltransferase involved in cell wall biosynthesis
MRIIAYVKADISPDRKTLSAVDYHRIINPLLKMNDVDVFITNDVNPKDYEKGCDIVMYSRVLPDKCMASIWELQKQYGFKIVVDVDDYWFLGKDHILAKGYAEDDFAAKQIQHIEEADIVLTTQERLYRKIIELNPNCHIIPNAIPNSGQFKIQTIPSDLVRLFWQGSSTHVNDLKILQEPIEALGKYSKRMKMVIAGYEEAPDLKEVKREDCADEQTFNDATWEAYNMKTEDDAREAMWFKMIHLYTASMKHQYKIIPAALVTEYYKAYEHADICLIPLLQNDFNSYKSNLKILEAAHMGLPVIVSKVHPYMDIPGVNYCKTSNDWVSHIKRLVMYPARRKEEGARLKEWADTYFNFDKINRERRQIFEHVSKMEPAL